MVHFLSFYLFSNFFCKGFTMALLSVEQKSIFKIWTDAKRGYLIPDYQRPYAWGEDECLTLWDDIVAFVYPDNNADNFNDEYDQYFLGSIVTFKTTSQSDDERDKWEVIDGQQRLTTLMLLLRAFYTKCDPEDNNKNIITIRSNIEKCLWKTNAFGNEPDMSVPKLISKVVTDDDLKEFQDIMRDGTVSPKAKSRYAINYCFFKSKIDSFLDKHNNDFPLLVNRILNNCIMLPIEADTMDTALRIFSTLNDRGRPLADADIFKAKFYQYFSSKGTDAKNDFINRWSNLSDTCDKIFGKSKDSPLDEIFARYMHYERSKNYDKYKGSTTDGLRKFYVDNAEYLFNESTFASLIELAEFWTHVYNLDDGYFKNPEVRKNLFILNYAPNNMWTYFLSVYYMAKRQNGKLDEDQFNTFLRKSIAFIWAYSFTTPGSNALRTPLYPEMRNLVEGKELSFKGFLQDKNDLKNKLENYYFSNNRMLTKTMLAWWTFQNEAQDPLSLTTSFHIEHIYAKERYNKDVLDQGLDYNEELIESIGNKSLLEQGINCRASDYRFDDKGRIYRGQGGKKATQIKELLDIASKSDFNIEDIDERKKNIIKSFLKYVEDNGLMKEEASNNQPDPTN